MNKKGLFLMGLAAMAFASCSNDDLMSDGSGTSEPVVVGAGEPTYVTFSLNVNDGAKSRAGNIEVPAAEKTAIDNAYLFIFDSSSKVLENKFEVKPAAGVNSFTELVTAGDKKIYAIANPTSDMKTVLDGLLPKTANSTLDKFLKHAFTANNFTELGVLVPSAANMPMSSIDSTNVYKLEPGISETDAKAPDKKANKVELKLKRMVAKTTLNVTNAEYNNNKVGIVADSTLYTVRNQSKRTYFVQNKGTGFVMSPTYNIVDATKFGDEFLSNTDIDTKIGTSLYVTENTSISFLKGAAPYMILRSRYVPDKIVTAVYDDVANQTVGYTYKSNPAPKEVWKMVISKESSDESLMQNGTCFTDTLLWDAARKIAVTYKSDFKAAINDYTKGSYYRINLGETTDKTNGTTKYGTERNKYYTVSVNSVTGPGWNTPGGAEGNATDPVDQKTYVNVTISVADWEKVEQDVDLN